MTPDRARTLNAPVTTERLALEPQTAGHAAEMFAPLQDRAIYEWISLNPPESVEALREHFARGESRLSPREDEAWLNWVVRRRSDGVCVGCVDACVADAAALNVGYVFFPPFWGRGYASEAVRAVVAHLAAQGVRRLRATVTRGNDASCRVLERSGFTFTRIIPDNDTIRGVKFDDLEYVLDLGSR